MLGIGDKSTTNLITTNDLHLDRLAVGVEVALFRRVNNTPYLAHLGETDIVEAILDGRAYMKNSREHRSCRIQTGVFDNYAGFGNEVYASANPEHVVDAKAMRQRCVDAYTQAERIRSLAAPIATDLIDDSVMDCEPFREELADELSRRLNEAQLRELASWLNVTLPS